MDLVTLIAACTLTAEPNTAPSAVDRTVMHALIFEQSGGEPWSFSVPGEGFARVLPTLKDAIREARAVRPDRGNIHVGLAGLAIELQLVTALMFAPCPNITLAERQITELVVRCKAASKPHPIYCAIAAYHGSWDRPHAWFADAVRATVKKGNAPNFEMPKDAYLDSDDCCRRTASSSARSTHDGSPDARRSPARLVECTVPCEANDDGPSVNRRAEARSCRRRTAFNWRSVPSTGNIQDTRR